jgi:hypothetical protein
LDLNLYHSSTFFFWKRETGQDTSVPKLQLRGVKTRMHGDLAALLSKGGERDSLAHLTREKMPTADKQKNSADGTLKTANRTRCEERYFREGNNFL